jgi:hypothetical protein
MTKGFKILCLLPALLTLTGCNEEKRTPLGWCLKFIERHLGTTDFCYTVNDFNSYDGGFKANQYTYLIDTFYDEDFGKNTFCCGVETKNSSWKYVSLEDISDLEIWQYDYELGVWEELSL